MVSTAPKFPDRTPRELRPADRNPALEKKSENGLANFVALATYRLVGMSIQRRSPAKSRIRNPEETRARLVQAGIELILQQGFTATTVDQVCSRAGVTKGSFFHHFANKDQLGVAALQAWGLIGTQLYTPAWADREADPLAALGRFLDIMSGFSRADSVCTCVVGMLSQEAAQSNEALRAQAAHELTDWTKNTGDLLARAQQKHCPEADFDPLAVAWQLNAIWQGSMLVSKTVQDPSLIRANLELTRAWLAGFFPEEVRSLLASTLPPDSPPSPPPTPS